MNRRKLVQSAVTVGLLSGMPSGGRCRTAQDAPRLHRAVLSEGAAQPQERPDRRRTSGRRFCT